MLILGGVDKAKSSKTAVWSYDPATGVTSKAGILKKAMHSSAAAMLGDAALRLRRQRRPAAARRRAAVRPTKKTTTIIGQMPTKRSEFSAVVDGEGPMAYLVGGFDGKDPTNDVIATLDGTTFQKVGDAARAGAQRRGRAQRVDDLGVRRRVGRRRHRVDPEGRHRRRAPRRCSGRCRRRSPTRWPSHSTTRSSSPGAASPAVGPTSCRRFDPATGALTVVTTLPSNVSDASAATSGPDRLPVRRPDSERDQPNRHHRPRRSGLNVAR